MNVEENVNLRVGSEEARKKDELDSDCSKGEWETVKDDGHGEWDCEYRECVMKVEFVLVCGVP